jgi:hypothetical protein
VLAVASAFGACFTAETPILTRRGWVRMNELAESDEVASANEHNPLAPVEFRPVLELFSFPLSRIWHLHVRAGNVSDGSSSQVIRTTAEHLFYVWGAGWVAAMDLRPGDKLRSHDGRMVTVDEVFDSGVEEPVYNSTVEDYHTYFVGSEGSGFSVWAHNTCDGDHHYVPVFMGSLVRRGGRAYASGVPQNSAAAEDFFEKIAVERRGEPFLGDAQFLGMRLQQRQRQAA